MNPEKEGPGLDGRFVGEWAYLFSEFKRSKGDERAKKRMATPLMSPPVLSFIGIEE